MIDYVSLIQVTMFLLILISVILIMVSVEKDIGTIWVFTSFLTIVICLIFALSVNFEQINYMQYGKENFLKRKIEEEKLKLLPINQSIEQLEMKLRG